MTLDVLPERTAGAAENMASDFLLLQRYPRAGAARYRHYGWRSPAFTFGYSQKISFVRGRLPAGETFDLCRRPTGGGLVDHRDDWTYALVIPRGHPLEEVRAAQSYRAIHEALAGAFKSAGVPVALKSAPEAASGAESGGPAGVCFERPELFDVVHAESGAKIAGGAQKRNKRGLLFQGSVWRPAAGGDGLDWGVLGEDFAGRLAAALGAGASAAPWPELDEGEVEGLTERYASPEWMEFR
ncbi:MAG TPA: lipoate--protein ligase family protein [Opitutaceae bacterium]|nr:lipoate--protein ligase family protein [Opitutaceae bacterium]